MATATETSCKQDVRKLIYSFENLAAFSYDAKKPLGSRPGSSAGKGYTSGYSPVGGGSTYHDMSMFFPVSPDKLSMNCEETVPYITLDMAHKRKGPDPDDIFTFFNIEETQQSESCNVCSEEHPSYSLCPSLPCTVCHNFHIATVCPYFRHIPQGASFNRDNFKIICYCGSPFDEEKWVCTFCPNRSPQLIEKYCSICSVFGHHCSHECPKDRDAAAEYKSIRDHYFSGAARVIPRASSGESVL